MDDNIIQQYSNEDTFILAIESVADSLRVTLSEIWGVFRTLLSSNHQTKAHPWIKNCRLWGNGTNVCWRRPRGLIHLLTIQIFQVMGEGTHSVPAKAKESFDFFILMLYSTVLDGGLLSQCGCSFQNHFNILHIPVTVVPGSLGCETTRRVLQDAV